MAQIYYLHYNICVTIISNMEQLTNRVKQNTKNREYYKNNAMDLGQGLGMSRNRISQVLNDCFKEGRFIKINTRPVIFIDKKTLEENISLYERTVLMSSAGSYNISDVLKLIKVGNVTTNLTISKDKKLTIDLNGNDLNVNKTVVNNGELTIRNRKGKS